MKYALLLGILISFSGTILTAQPSKDSLKPKMKWVKKAIYRVRDGELKNRDSLFDSELYSYVAYNKNGYPIEFINYFTNGSVYSKTVLDRNEKGDIQKATKKSASGELVNYWIYEYDSNGNTTEIKTYDAENNITEIQSYKYDENGNNIEITIKTPSINIRRYEFEYNADNKVIKESKYKPDGSLRNTSIISYDKNGNESIVIKTSPEGLFVKVVSEYDERNNLIMEKSFDKHSQLKRQISFEYVYDHNGNWITNKRSINGKLNMVCERQIEYYE